MNSDIAARIPEEPHDVSRPMPHHHVNYVAIFLLLVVLTIITVGVAFVPQIKSEIAKVLVALTIASIKASFVVLFFMHLKFEGKLIYLILLVPVLLTIIMIMALIPDVVHGPLFNPTIVAPGTHSN